MTAAPRTAPDAPAATGAGRPDGDAAGEPDPSEAMLLAAAGVLLAHGPPGTRSLGAAGWTAEVLLDRRRALVVAALRRSSSLRSAAHLVLDPVLGSRDVDTDSGTPASTDGPDLAGLREPEPSPGRVAGLEHRLRRAERRNAELAALVPSRADRARRNRQLSQLRAAEGAVAALTARVAALETANAALVDELTAIRREREEALAERDQARRSHAALASRTEVLPAGDDRRPPIAVPTAEPPATSAMEVASGAAGHRAVATVGPARDWEVRPLGGGREIGGSALLITVAGRRVLVDAGLRPGGASDTELRPARIDEVGDRLDAIIVTHAHTDHAGYVPAVIARFPSAPILCSAGTAALLPTMWRDSLAVLTNRARAQARWMGTPPAPMYTEHHLADAERRLTAVPFGAVHRLGELDIRLFPAGHVLGAAGVVLSADGGRGGRLVVTGDVSDQRQASVAECELPADEVIHGADLLVIESTHCQANLPRREDQVTALVEEIRDVVTGGRGRVLVPAFALGRAQEIALILAERLPEVPILIDGLAREISRIYDRHGEAEAARLTRGRQEARERAARASRFADLVPPAQDARPVQIFSDTVQAVPPRGRFQAIRGFRQGVVVTTSGMLTGGPAVPWARSILPDPRAALFLCGYQDEESPGRLLAGLVGRSADERAVLRLDDNGAQSADITVAARVRDYRLSAHADRRGLLDIIDRVGAREVMLVHGTPRNQDRFRGTLEMRGQSTVRTGDWRRS